MLELSHVTKCYGPRTVLSDVSFRVGHGEFLLVHGPSGAGKTTLLRLLLMEELPTSGTVRVGDWSSTRLTPRRVALLRRRVGVIFQDFKLLRDRNVFENVALPLRVAGQDDSLQMRARVTEVLAAVGLSAYMQASPTRLSGGEQQRVALARALVFAPPLLLADEPTANLDPASGAGILELLRGLPALGTSVILTTSDASFAPLLGVRAIELRDGRLYAEGSDPSGLRAAPPLGVSVAIASPSVGSATAPVVAPPENSQPDRAPTTEGL